MKNKQKIIRYRRRKCRHCGRLYKPDPRTRKTQKYCSADECRKASKAASWKRWRKKPVNQDYYKGKIQVARTREWRRRNPGYGKRRSLKQNALQNVKSLQTLGIAEDTPCLVSDALPNETLTQPALIAGLIATLTGSALPNEIAELSRHFILLGHDILGTGSGIKPKGGYDEEKTCYMPAENAACAKKV